MPGQKIKINYDARCAAPPAAFDLHDESGHHRYYGSSALNGGEQIVESRQGKRPRRLGIFGL
jgi:hypothetical protein